MSIKKAPKFKGHFRAGKKVVPVIFYAPPQVHRALKAKCRKLDITQDAYLNGLAARSVGPSKKAKKVATKTETAVGAPIL